MKLVLLPGMDGTGDLFEPITSALPPNIEPVVVSYPCDEELGYGALKGIARAAIPHAEPYALLGESFSGPIAASLAAENTGELRALIFCCSFIENPSTALSIFSSAVPVVPTHSRLARAGRNFLLGANSGDIRDLAERSLAQVSPDVVRFRMSEIAAVDESANLRLVRVPTLYLRASDDRLVKPRSSERILEELPHTVVVEIDGPHLLLQSRPSECATAIAQFIQSATGVL